MLRNAIRSQGAVFDELTTALGYICVHWARLESTLGEFVELLTPLEHGDISRSITSNMDIRYKIQTIRALAFLRKPTKQWFDRMILLLDYIDNNLRVRRNRYVHDAWYGPEQRGQITRVSKRVKFLRPQAFKLTLQTEDKIRTRLHDVRKLADELDSLTFIMLVELRAS